MIPGLFKKIIVEYMGWTGMAGMADICHSFKLFWITNAYILTIHSSDMNDSSFDTWHWFSYWLKKLALIYGYTGMAGMSIISYIYLIMLTQTTVSLWYMLITI